MMTEVKRVAVKTVDELVALVEAGEKLWIFDREILAIHFRPVENLSKISHDESIAHTYSRRDCGRIVSASIFNQSVETGRVQRAVRKTYRHLRDGEILLAGGEYVFSSTHAKLHRLLTGVRVGAGVWCIIEINRPEGHLAAYSVSFSADAILVVEE